MNSGRLRSCHRHGSEIDVGGAYDYRGVMFSHGCERCAADRQRLDHMLREQEAYRKDGRIGPPEHERFAKRDSGPIPGSVLELEQRIAREHSKPKWVRDSQYRREFAKRLKAQQGRY